MGIVWGPEGYRPVFCPDGRTVIYETLDPSPVLMQWDSQGSAAPTAFLAPAQPGLAQTRADVSLANGAVAFTGNAGSGPATYTANADGGSCAMVPGARSQAYPCWFAGGASLAATVVPDQELVTFPPSGVSFAIVSPPDLYVGMASVSPADDNAVILAGQANNGQKYDQEKNRIWTLNTQTQAKSELIQRQGRAPWWAPDGQSLVFESNRSGKGYALYTATASGQDVTEITDPANNAQHGKFSPDGRSVTFAGKQNAAGNWQVAIMTLS